MIFKITKKIPFITFLIQSRKIQFQYNFITHKTYKYTFCDFMKIVRIFLFFLSGCDLNSEK